jgi:hypothetical protein
MSIIVPDAPSEVVKNQVIKIKQNNLELWKYIKDRHTAIFNMVWYDSQYSAKQIVDGFGTDGASLFQFSGDIQDLLYALDNTYEPLVPPKDYVVNEDGTVTVEE